jgi:hypothetical protein
MLDIKSNRCMWCTWREELGNPALDTSTSKGSLDDVLKPQTRNRLINEEHCYLSVLNKNENIRRGLKVFLFRWFKRKGNKNAVTAWMFRVGFPTKQLDGWCWFTWRQVQENLALSTSMSTESLEGVLEPLGRIRQSIEERCYLSALLRHVKFETISTIYTRARWRRIG